MRRALGLAFALVVLTATPALAHGSAIDLATSPAPVVDLIAGGDEHGEVAGESDGEDGTDPAEFAALLLAGVATVAAVAALIFATKRAPA